MDSVRYDVGVVGAGITGLSVATFLRGQRPDDQLLLLEQAAGPGGAIRSHRQDGYLAEWGPHGFLDNCEESRELIELAGLQADKVMASLSTFVRYVCLDGRLQCIPQTPLKILRQPLVPWTAKLRVLADLWTSPLAGEPTVAGWVAHRFGSALVPFADAVFTGTYAGDIDRLRIDAVMPGVRALERAHGSVIRGLLARMRHGAAARKGKRRAMPSMTSFREGMTMLPERLAARLGEGAALRYGCAVQRVCKDEQGWCIETDQGGYSCRHLVLSLPTNRALALLAGTLSFEPPPLSTLPEARICSVLLGFDDSARIPFGFGYLAPEREGRFALGALFSSHMFAGRAPAGHQLIEVLVGGRRHPERLELADKELIRRSYEDLRQLMEMPKPPVFAAVLRPEAGIPQLEQGYTGLLAWRDAMIAAHSDLHVCGFGWQGIGINDMVKEAKRVADRIAARPATREGAEIKGVYF